MRTNLSAEHPHSATRSPMVDVRYGVNLTVELDSQVFCQRLRFGRYLNRSAASGSSCVYHISFQKCAAVYHEWFRPSIFVSYFHHRTSGGPMVHHVPVLYAM